MIKKIKIYSNSKKISDEIASQLSEKLVNNGFCLVDEDYDLAIAVGGDGTFIRTIRENNFNQNVIYVGINTGSLGFLQEISPEDIDEFIEKIKCNNYSIQTHDVQETVIESSIGIKSFYSINELLIRNKDLSVLTLNIEVNDNLLEEFVGDGVIVSTQVGSTAYNLSFGGSIIYPNSSILQITPMAPLNNNTYLNLINSVVMTGDKKIVLKPYDKNVLIGIDGKYFEFEDIKKITTTICNKKIKCLKINGYNYTKIIRDKLLK